MDSSLRGREFHCREWVFDKLLGYVNAGQTPAHPGVVLLGESGCGKTALMTELIWPTASQASPDARHRLRSHVLAYYFCSQLYSHSLRLSHFLFSLRQQIVKHPEVGPAYEQLLRRTGGVELFTYRCMNDSPDRVFAEGLLKPLLALQPPARHYLLLVDGLDETRTPDKAAAAAAAAASAPSRKQLQRSGGSTAAAAAPAGPSGCVFDLLARHQRSLPAWLVLVCSSRRDDRRLSRAFAGFSKLQLTDARKPQVLRDVQQFILWRLDSNEQLRQHLNRETACLLNQLHIKGNACFAYLELVLDAVAQGTVQLSEVAQMPGTLAGVFLYLFQRLFSTDPELWQLARCLLALLLALGEPAPVRLAYQAVSVQNPGLSFARFAAQVARLRLLLRATPDRCLVLAHNALSDWLQDAKYCTPAYLVSQRLGHCLLAAHCLCYWRQPPSAPAERAAMLRDFARSLLAAGCGLQPEHLLLLTLLLLRRWSCGPRLLLRIRDPPELRLMAIALLNWDEAVEQEAASVAASANRPIEPADTQLSLEDEAVDGDDGGGCSGSTTPLMLAAYAGDLATIDRLLAGPNSQLNRRDSGGYSALDWALLGGRADAVTLLLSHGAKPDGPPGCWVALPLALALGRPDLVTLLLSAGADLDRVDSDGRTALMLATARGQSELIGLLLDTGARVDARDNGGRSALLLAALCLHEPISVAAIQRLLDAGADINLADADGRTALIHACLAKRHELMDFLLDSDADVDRCDRDGISALLVSSRLGDFRAVQALLFFNANPHQLDRHGRSALSLAAVSGQSAVVEALLARGLDEGHADNAGLTVLHHAAGAGHADVCQLLLGNGAATRSQDSAGRTPLLLAVLSGQAEVAALLAETDRLAAGIPGHDEDGLTPLLAAFQLGRPDLLELLLSRGADPNMTDRAGRSLLYLAAAASEGGCSLASLLLDCGASSNLADEQGRTPLHVAAWLGRAEAAGLLISRGADVNAKDADGGSALSAAAWQGQAHLCQLLLANGAEVDSVCRQGATPLCIAAQEGHLAVCQVLLDAGARANHVDRIGRTPYRVAVKCGHRQVAELLLARGASPGVASSSSNGGGGGGSGSGATGGSGGSGGSSGGGGSGFTRITPIQGGTFNSQHQLYQHHQYPHHRELHQFQQQQQQPPRSKPTLQLILNNGATVINANASDLSNSSPEEAASAAAGSAVSAIGRGASRRNGDKRRRAAVAAAAAQRQAEDELLARRAAAGIRLQSGDRKETAF
ncbi:hypothetical protein BOX15_Mlig008846g3 [Macrostomum lignano]|uniref:Uncharacterized protein n=2 Tax=Macrostomum lignano TaxID=282301 RepID=A0A267ES82_9PLAT|nr:hypothetical protein BOX15_Mlig008846g3 [Macrostomum lignano]